MENNNIRPKHYTHGIEVYKFINSHNLNFNLGNVIKYVCRANYKHETPIEDLMKAKTYLEFEIERIEQQEREGEEHGN